MFYFAIVGHYGLKTIDQFLRHSKCKKGSPNDRLEEIYQVHISLTASHASTRLMIMFTVLKLNSFLKNVFLKQLVHGLYHLQNDKQKKKKKKSYLSNPDPYGNKLMQGLPF